MENLKVGFARIDITPQLGVDIAGYFVKRIADGVLDALEAVALAVSSGGNTAVIISIDNCAVDKTYLDSYRATISEALKIPVQAIFIHSTHTHTGPDVKPMQTNPLNLKYAETLGARLVLVAKDAFSDMKTAKMGIGVGKAERIAFIRRYRMKDGTAKTNPGVNNPDILHSIGETDERVSVVRFDREGASSVVLLNFANHPDTVGGTKISADWPGLTRRTVEKCIENTECILLNGAEGDVNHVNVNPRPGEFNDLFMDFDGCSRGYGHTRHMARVICGAVMSVFDKVEYLTETNVRFINKTVDIPSNKATEEELVLARKYFELHNSGRDDLIPYTDMMLTTVVSEATRMVRLENAPDAFPMLFSAVAIGGVALFGIPGEPFNAIGRALKESDGWKMVIPCCNTNAREGYFPMRDSYDEGGYEARSSRFKAGVAERIIEEAFVMLDEIK